MMYVKVEMLMATTATNDHKSSMRAAAKKFTKNEKSIEVSISKKNDRKITVTFSMKTTAQYKVVDSIASEFSDYLYDYEDIAISF